jgi:hypothetical protein
MQIKSKKSLLVTLALLYTITQQRLACYSLLFTAARAALECSVSSSVVDTAPQLRNGFERWGARFSLALVRSP